jgi:hypothetical protein
VCITSIHGSSLDAIDAAASKADEDACLVDEFDACFTPEGAYRNLPISVMAYSLKVKYGCTTPR